MYAEQSPYFNLRIPHLTCFVRVRRSPLIPDISDV
jgi:hypothetical protein